LRPRPISGAAALAADWWTANIKWNFTKFLVDKKGRVVERYAPMTPPSAIEAQIERLLPK
jgi:glutathione peroxidase-family protein